MQIIFIVLLIIIIGLTTYLLKVMENESETVTPKVPAVPEDVVTPATTKTAN